MTHIVSIKKLLNINVFSKNYFQKYLVENITKSETEDSANYYEFYK
jgi:hypothetical protein